MADRRRPAASASPPRIIAAAALGYLAGTLPSADIASRLAPDGTTDLRRVGSANPGAANAIKQLGPRWGYAVLAADVAKGAAGSVSGRLLAGPTGAHVGGTAAVVGHCFPLWTGFRGGKGVAASAGQCLATFPAYMPIDLAVAAVTASSRRWKQRAFAATAVTSAVWVLAGLAWWRRDWPNGWGPPPGPGLPLAAAASSAVILSKFAAAATSAASIVDSPAPTVVTTESAAS